MSPLQDAYRRAGVMLVPVDDQFALIDTVGSRVFIVNAAAAWIWTRLGTDCPVSEEVAQFVKSLDDRSLLQTEKSAEVQKAGTLEASPLILSQTPLQVAANNSNPMADPFLSI